MKKHFASILITAFILSSFTACSVGGQENPPGDQSSISNSNASDSESSSANSKEGSSTIESKDNPSESKPTEKLTGIYGETEIPDIPCGDKDFEGKASTMADHDALEQCLDSMVFETHTFGDYKVSLVGDSVRTDKANFPDSIYTQNLRVEVEKNGEKIGGKGGYCDTFTYVTQFLTEYRLFEDKIGSYLDIYELDIPVIAMRYFYDNNSGRTVTKAVQFATIVNDEINAGFVGLSQKGTGISLNSDPDVNDPNTMLDKNSEDDARCRISVFAADEFKVIDSKTLVDEEAGIKYTFNFSDPPQFELYTTEKIM